MYRICKLMNMTEIWRDIKDYEGLYQVSNLGRVKSLERFVKYNDGRIAHYKERILKLCEDNKGYFHTVLHKNGIGKTLKVHRLVAMAFPDLVDWTDEAKGKPFDELQVNHKNEFDKTNNCVSNLEWCTNEYNTHYGTHYKRISKSMTNNPKISKPVLQYTLDMVFVKEYPSISEASRQSNIQQNSINLCCQGKLKTAGGYIWKYKDYSPPSSVPLSGSGLS